MNNIHRLVWNEITNTWVAVAETARSKGKGSGRAARKAFLAALIASGFGATSALADLPATTVVPASGKTNAYISANGVPVVNIETANATGLSHNYYTKYNVEANGMVLNNGNNSQVVRQSQLAGQVTSNLNLVNEAKIILNEVVSTNRSTLAGFTEVLGGKADVIVANPNGITCNGCGFINTDRVTLTTGTSNVAGDGSLTGFTVNRGDVLIEGLGANASTQQIFDIVTRSVKVDGKINVPVANSLSLTTGNNIWNYAGRIVTGSVAGSGAAPTYAIDSTTLGGMYAGRIRIIATEAGVGVRMLGEVAASTDDFTLSSAGKIEIQSAISAARDVSIASTSATGTEDLFLNGAGAKISASRDLAFSATTGQIKLTEGELYAANNLTLTGATLSDVSTPVNSTPAKTRFAGVNNTLTTTGAASINGSVWGAGSALLGTFDSLSIGANSATIYAGTTLGLNTTNDLALATAAVHSAGNLTLAASAGAISTAAGAGQGVQTTAGSLSLTAGNGLANAGTMTSDLGSVTARINGAITNSGTLHAKTTLDIADKANGSTENVTNSGTLIADGSLTAKAVSFTNQSGGKVQGTTGTSLNATSLTNAGTFIASNTAGQSGTFTLASLTNSGTLQSAEDLVLNVTGTLGNTGKLLATHDLSVNAGSSALAITNTNPGVIQAGNTLTMTGANATLNTQSGTVLGNTVGLTLSSVNNSGTLQSNAGMTLAIGNGLTNSGTLLAKTNLNSNSASLTNSGTLQANQGSTITTTGALANTGTLIASDSASSLATLNVGTLSNTAGVIQSAQNLAINVSGGTFANATKIIAVHGLTVNSTGSGMTLTNQSGGYLQAGSTPGDTLSIGGTAVVLNNNAGGFLLGDRLGFTLASLTNAGTIQGGAAASTITASGTVTNSGTLSLANNAAGSGTITADTISNSGMLQSQGAAALNLATTLTNSGSLLTTGALTVRGTDSAYTVSDTGRMQSGGLMDVKGQGGGSGVDITVGGSGVMFGNSMGVNAGTLTINNGGMVTSSGNMTLAANTLSFGGTTSRIVAANSGTGNASITLANAFSNVGAVHSGGNMSFSAPSITNTATGGFSALNTLTLSATGGDLYNAGALYAGSQLNASSTGTFTNVSGSGTIDSSGSMSLSAATFLNNNTVNATNNITISASAFRNETPGGDTRTWGANSAKTTTQTGYDSQGYNGHGCCDQYETWYYADTWTRDQYYAGGTPTKPQIIGGGTLTVQNFNTGTNIGGVMSANTVTLTGNGGATFTNNDLALLRENYTDNYRREIKYIAAGPAQYHDYSHYLSTVIFGTSTLSSLGAGIRATTLNASGFSLVNAGSPFAASANSTSASGTTGAPLSGSVSGTSAGTGVSGTTTASGAPAISFGGLVIALPTNPNGYFVVSTAPGSKYLVETNPLFAVGSNYVGSDYMASRYGYNPDTVMKRLGDSNYEAYLIRQQLISQIGKNILNGYGNEADQMKRLMDQAVDEGKRVGFVFGQALTTDQIANLKSDVVWMVETTIAGQKVLAPVVYLAASTKNSIETGAVIAGENVNMNLTSVTNTGGTISGSKSLNITSKGDITNTSGTIKGGDVAIKSTEGSIKNETLVQGSGGDKSYVTTIGKTAGITATGNLDLDAKKDITVKGAQVKAGGDASLAAGGDITFETVVNKNTDTTHSSSNNGLQSSRETTTTTTEKNIGSGLEAGGNLKLKSGGDTTLTGTNASVGGDLDVNTGGDFKVLSVQDKTTTHSESNTSGLGVGGGVGGTEKVTTDSFTGKNVSSTLTVGGNAKVKSEGEMTLQGSDLSVAGNADINAKKGVSVLDGLDEQRTTTKTETTTFLKTGSSGAASSGSGSSSSSKSGQAYGKTQGQAGAKAEASGEADLKFSETTTTVNKSGSNTSVSSNLKVGGKLKVKTDGTLKVQGSNVEAGGDLAVDAKNVEVTAGRNETFSNTTTDRVSTGIYNEGKSEAKAGAEAQAKAGTTGNSASGNAGASAEAGGTTTIGARVEKEESTAYKLRNTGSTLKSGGNLSIKAKEDVTFVGSTAESGGDMSIDAKNITSKAAQDIEINTESKSKQTAGLYIDGKVSAEAKASADAGKINIGGDPANAEVKGEAKADVSAGIRYKNEAESSTVGSVTQVTSSFKSGGSITRKATNTITDQGTQIEAEGDINQSAREIKEIEANNSTFSSKDSSSHDVKIGVGASASASAGANAKGETESDAGAGAGFRAKYEGEIKGEKEGSTTAVTSKYKSGGNISSKSEEKTTLIGTQFESKGDVNLEAGSLEFKAAKDTTTKSATSHEMGAELKVDVVGKAGGSLKAEYKGSGESEKTSTARTGSVNASGNLNIKTKGGASFEGTNLESGGDASVKAGGSVDFKAARDTSESSSKSGSVSLELSSSKSSKGGKLEGEYAQKDSSSSKAQTGGIKSGGKLEVSAGKDANFEGTELKSKGNASIEAGGNVSLKAAKDTETSLGFGVEASLSAEKGKEGSKKGGSVGGNVEYSDKAESKGTSIESDGKVTIKGNNVVNQEADINAKGGEKVTGNVINEKTDNHDIAVGVEMSVSGEKETKAKP